MNLKKRLFTNMFLRNMLADLSNRSVNSTIPGNFTPYFQYRIGDYQPDYYLYFPKEPYNIRYRNEAFNKLKEYDGYNITQYLDFHYTTYSDKEDFVRFLQYEVTDRINKKPGNKSRIKLLAVQQWVNEKEKQLLPTSDAILKHSTTGTESIEEYVQLLTGKATQRLEQVITSTEERMEGLTDSLITGHIELNNHNHLDKVIQVLILLQRVQAPREIAKAEQLFKKFSFTDIASILHLHFDIFKNKKINTLQGKIREADERLNPNNIKVEKLSKALQDFFY